MLDKAKQLSTHEAQAQLALSDNWSPVGLIDRGSDGSNIGIIWADAADLPPDGMPLSQAISDDTSAGPVLTNGHWFATSMSELPLYAMMHPGIPPSGLIFHMARCGSTLAWRILATLDATASLVEPEIINSLITWSQKSVEDDSRLGHLRAGLMSIIRAQGGRYRRGYIKLTSINICAIDTIRACADQTPMLFIHRDPVEVLVSLTRIPPGWTNADSQFYRDLGFETEASLEERCTLILKVFLETALAAESRGDCRFVGYPQLIERMIDGDIPEFLGYEVDQATRTRMIEATRHHSKSSDRTFEPDSRRKKAEASPEIQRLASEHLADLYEEVLTRS